MKLRKRIIFTMLAALVLSATSATGQEKERGIPAMAALNRIAAKHGSQFAQKIVRMRGAYGTPQPEEWWIVVHDPKSPTLLREFWVGDTRATNEGPNHDFYPKQTPAGYIPLKNLKLDSLDAFELLNGEANKAKVGFDSVNYFLRCREFSDEPVWTLQALDKHGSVTGIVDVSAETARVLRTVWIYAPESRRQPPKIVDSDLVGGLLAGTDHRPPTEVDESTLVRPDEPPLDPLLRDPAVSPSIPPASDVERRMPDRRGPDSRPPATDRQPAPRRDPLSEEAEVIPLEEDVDPE